MSRYGIVGLLEKQNRAEGQKSERAEPTEPATVSELCAALREAQSVLAALLDPNSQHVSSFQIWSRAVAAETRARNVLNRAETDQ